MLLNEIISGFFAGLTQIAVGHPFDTTKVLIQNKHKWFGLPLSSYYKGYKLPLLSAILINCSIFPIYEYTKQYTNNSFISGYISGSCIYPFIFISNIYKIKKQTNQKLTFSSFRPKYGYLSIYLRESLGMCFYFGFYNYCKEEKKYNSFISGAIAGLMNWTFTYPIDVIQSRQIAQEISIKEAILQKQLWKGYGVCSARAMIVNAVIFSAYEQVKKILNKIEMY